MTTRTAQQSVSPKGLVEISDGAIVAVIHEAVLSCYGIVDMAPRSLRSAIGKRLGLTSVARGIGILVNDDDAIVIDLSLVLEYGTPIFTVATNVMQTVKFRVEDILGMRVERVNISVDGLRVSGESGSTT
jgi:uncharacterized alkaline shock family protein YloU